MRDLTEKELLVVQEFVSTKRVPRELIEKLIRTESTGWAAAIREAVCRRLLADMSESKIKARAGYSLNSFTYRRIGG